MDDFRPPQRLRAESPVLRSNIDILREHRPDQNSRHQVFEAALLKTKSELSLTFFSREQALVTALESAAKNRFGARDPDVRLIGGEFVARHWNLVLFKN
jgi:hypothetical protein